MKSWNEFCGTETGGRYVLADEVIGVGSLGAVYSATDSQSGETVAIKLLHSRIGQTGSFDADCLSCTDPGFIPVRDAGPGDGENPFIVMDLINAPQLRGPVSPLESGQILAGVSQSLSAAYAQHGLNHLNLNPRNILLIDREGSKKTQIADFGHAAQAGAVGAIVEAVRNGTVGPEYLSPEQLRERGPSPQSDVYAMGVILFELLTGRVPFEASGGSLDAFLQHLDTASPPRISTLAPDLGIESFVEATILRCLSLSPSSRPESVAELEALIGPPLAGRTGDTIAPGSLPPPSSQNESFDVPEEEPDSQSAAVATSSDSTGQADRYDPWAGLNTAPDSTPAAPQPETGSTLETIAPTRPVSPTRTSTDDVVTMVPGREQPSAGQPQAPPAVATPQAPPAVATPQPAPPADATLAPDAVRQPPPPVAGVPASPVSSSRSPIHPPQDGTLIPGGGAVSGSPVEEFPDTFHAPGSSPPAPVAPPSPAQPAGRSGIPKSVLLVGTAVVLLAGGAAGFAALRNNTLTESAFELARRGRYESAAATLDSVDPLTALLLNRNQTLTEVFNLGVENVERLIDEKDISKAIRHVDDLSSVKALSTAVGRSDSRLAALRKKIADPVLADIRQLTENGDYRDALDLLNNDQVQKLGTVAPDVLDIARLRRDVHDNIVRDMKQHLAENDFAWIIQRRALRFEFSDPRQIQELLDQAGFHGKLHEIEMKTQAGEYSTALRQSHELVDQWQGGTQESFARRARARVADAGAQAAVEDGDSESAFELWQISVADLNWLTNQHPEEEQDIQQLCDVRLRRGQTRLSRSREPLNVQEAIRGIEELQDILSISPGHAECRLALTTTAQFHEDKAGDATQLAETSAGTDPEELQKQNQLIVDHTTIALVAQEDSGASLFYLRAVARLFLKRPEYEQSAKDFQQFLTLVPDPKLPQQRDLRALAQYQLAELLAAAPVESLQDGKRAQALAAEAAEYLFERSVKNRTEFIFLRLMSARLAWSAAFAEQGNFDAAREVIESEVLPELDRDDAKHTVIRMKASRMVELFRKQKKYRIGRPEK